MQYLYSFSLKHFGTEFLLKIHWLTSFLLLEAVYKPSRCKKGPKRGPSPKFEWIWCRAYSTLRRLPSFCNIQKLDLSSKTDIGKTAGINLWLYTYYILGQVIHQESGNLFELILKPDEWLVTSFRLCLFSMILFVKRDWVSKEK